MVYKKKTKAQKKEIYKLGVQKRKATMDFERKHEKCHHLCHIIVRRKMNEVDEWGDKLVGCGYKQKGILFVSLPPNYTYSF